MNLPELMFALLYVLLYAYITLLSFVFQNYDLVLLSDNSHTEKQKKKIFKELLTGLIGVSKRFVNRVVYDVLILNLLVRIFGIVCENICGNFQSQLIHLRSNREQLVSKSPCNRNLNCTLVQRPCQQQ